MASYSTSMLLSITGEYGLKPISVNVLSQSSTNCGLLFMMSASIAVNPADITMPPTITSSADTYPAFLTIFILFFFIFTHHVIPSLSYMFTLCLVIIPTNVLDDVSRFNSMHYETG